MLNIGLHAVGQDLFNRPSIGEVLRAVHAYFADHGLWLQTVLDVVLSVLLLSAFVIAAVALDTPVRFRDKFNQPIYYSLVTYYATYGPENEVSVSFRFRCRCALIYCCCCV
jgi:hypothetical protein